MLLGYGLPSSITSLWLLWRPSLIIHRGAPNHTCLHSHITHQS